MAGQQSLLFSDRRLNPLMNFQLLITPRNNVPRGQGLFCEARVKTDDVKSQIKSMDVLYNFLYSHNCFHPEYVIQGRKEYKNIRKPKIHKKVDNMNSFNKPIMCKNVSE